MKRTFLIGMASLMIAAGLSAYGIPQEKYDAVVVERDEAVAAKNEAQTKIASLEAQYNAALAEKNTALDAVERAQAKIASLEGQILPPGRIVLKKVIVSGDRTTTSDFWINYGRYFNHDDQFLMQHGDEVDSGLVLSPGTYQIREDKNNLWYDPVIVIKDPGADSLSQDVKAIINLAPGETIIVTYYDSTWGSADSLLIDQSNETHYYTSYGGSSETLSQSFTPSENSLKGLDALLRPGGLFPIKGMPSFVELKVGGPNGEALGTSVSFVLPPAQLGGIVWARFVFENAIPLTVGNQYYVSWFMPGAPYITWIGSDSDPYKGGTAFNSAGSAMGSTDFCFRTLY